MQRPRIPHRTDPVLIHLGGFELSKQGASRWDLTDPYYLAVTLRWPPFFAALLLCHLVINLLFASLYALRPGSVANAYNIVDDFFFSMETLATVGYGTMAPATLYGHTVAAVEILCGLTFTAIMTGLIFVRFSRPRAKILFATNLVIARHGGQPTLMLRIANGRLTMLARSSARMNFLVLVRGPDGERQRTIHDLKLERSEMPVFALTWTLMHRIDASSPLAGLTRETLAEADGRFFAAVEAHDTALGASVHSLKTYSASDVLFGTRYRDAITVSEAGIPNADLRLISDVEPDPEPA